MSFILDALKKSESDRQRQAGPALFEVRIAPPRSRFPLWSLVVAALLGLNALILGGWLIVRAARTQALATSAPGTAAAATGVATAAAALPAPAAVAAAPPAAPATPSTGAAAPLPRASAALHAGPAPPGPRDPEVAALDPAPDPTAGAAERADDEPAVDSGVLAPRAQSNGGGSVRTGPTGLPTRDELHSTDVASLPELRLDLHVYDADPRKRFVLINMHRAHEGESIPEGVRVDRITEAGAELDYKGQHFLLPHE